MRPGSRADHDTFCQHDEWITVRSARGKSVGHHITYELPLPDGRILRTRISRPPNTTVYGAGLWAEVLRTQLQVTEDEFWACVNEKVRPRRGDAPEEVPGAGLPAWLVAKLIGEMHLPESQVAGMSEAEARAALQTHWERKGDGPATDA